MVVAMILAPCRQAGRRSGKTEERERESVCVYV